ncbi:MAG TPA: hypothetical protein VGE26_09415 [Sphingobacteriaceae bacterium]
MDIKHFDVSYKRSFFGGHRRAVSGSMAYYQDPEEVMTGDFNMTLNHRGKGIENQLINAVVLHERKHRIRYFTNDRDPMID